MKKTTIAAVILMIISTCSFAGNSDNRDKDKAKGESTATIENTTKDNVYKLHYSSSMPGRVGVRISDATGKVILVDYIRNKEGFIRPYNFQGLSEGSYFVEINDHAGKIKIPLAHTNSESAQYLKTDVEALSASKKFQLVMHGKFKTGIEVIIYNNHNSVVFSDFITEKNSFSKVYDLSKTGNEAFTFVVKSNSKLIHSEKF